MERLLQTDRRLYAAMIGISIGLIGGIITIMLALLGPIITTGLVIGTLAAIFVLTDIDFALYGIIAVLILIPFGTFPFDIGFTPTLLDMAIGAFLLIYLLQWMTGKRYNIRLTPIHALLSIYVLWLLLSFALGLRHSWFTVTTVRQFAQTLLSIGMVFVLVDLLREPRMLRRLVLVILVAVGVQTLVVVGLYVLPDATAENILNRLGRIGYPVGGVIRYIESNPALSERAIGTWIDPNSLGGLLAISGVLIAPQIFASKPVLRYRWLTFAVFVLIAISLFLTFSRASMLAFAIGLGIITVFRYRRFLPVMAFGAVLLLFLPQTQGYIERFIDAFTGADLATQMRIGEYTDSLRLIERYPIFGVGFTGTPDIDIYTDVASMYLIMANQIGLVGVAIFLTTIGGVLFYGLYAWQFALRDAELESIHLGYHAALLTALANAVADLYFFRLDFQGPITLFWITVALALASSRLVLAKAAQESTVAKTNTVY